MLLAATLALLLMPDAVPAPPPAASPLWGTLRPGPYRPGHRVIRYEDTSRLAAPKSGPYAQPGAPVPRALVAHVWYPGVADHPAPALTLEGYALLDFTGRLDPPSADRAAPLGYLRGTVQRRFGTLTDEQWSALRAMAGRAGHEIPAAAGRFPLLVGMLRPVSTAITAEYLASHGYVVAFLQDSTQTLEAWDLDTSARDMEVVADRLRGQPFVDPARTGAIGFSGSGFAQVLLAMRNAHVDALVDLESALFAQGFRERLVASSSWSPEALRAPFLHVYGRELSASAQYPEDLAAFRAMRYSERLHLVLEEKGLDHWDVATEGVASVLLGMRPRPEAVRRTFEAATEYTRRFLDAHVKQDATARAWLAAPPDANGFGGVVSAERLAGIAPPPTAADVERLRLKGGPAVVEALRRARELDPRSPVLAAQALNTLGYRLLGSGDAAAASDVLGLAAELFPTSANAHDSHAEALAAAGRTADARRAAQRVLELIDEDEELAPQVRAALKKANEARVAPR
jgi:tetratricopeptide (TPR) repeat protein